MSNKTTTPVAYEDPVLYFSVVSSSLSILGSFAIFGSYFLIPEIQLHGSLSRALLLQTSYQQSVIIWFLMFIGYLVSGIAHFANVQDSVCTIQSGITTYSSIVSFYLTVAIAIHIFVAVVYRNNSTSSWQYILCANVVSWIFPGIITVVARAKNVLGRDGHSSVNTGPWCWISHAKHDYVFWIFMAGKGWEFLCYLITTSLYVLSQFYRYLKYRRWTFREIHENLRVEDKNYLYVWFLLYILRIWGSIRSMMNIGHVDSEMPGSMISHVLMYLQALGDPGQAFCNAVLFCLLDETVREYIVEMLQKCCRNPRNLSTNGERARLVPALGNNILANHSYIATDEMTDLSPISRYKSTKASRSFGKYNRVNVSVV
ncbi:G-protein coupled receptor 157-like [Ruditapes philippinarum]|uniref:G-protein coupled receptor 157-like n=1 Tax=Ruditapes philippinarum TaxID=129788 RepID=UPI00295B2F0C|nr:G-protein coupled receptor 157-like [Ruditapes philippinarum]